MRTVELTIEDIAFGGKGVGREKGKAVFVPYTIEGETITAEIVQEKKQFAEAELRKIQESSAHRVTPACPYFGRCGGCAYQHLEYEHQLTVKSRQVRDVLRRIGKIPEPPMRQIIPSPLTYSYRNRITVHAQEGVIGFFRRESNRLIDVERCPISNDEVNGQLHELRQSRPRDGHYGLRAGKGPRIFAQTNDGVAERLRRLVIELVPPGQQLLIDAYCGAGFFAKAVLDRFERVIGIDWDRFAIEEARKNATPKETYIAGNVDDELPRIVAGDLNYIDSNNGDRHIAPALENRRSRVLIIDPPATGLTGGVCDTITTLSPDRLIYISCNPATLARDLKVFGSKFRINSITPLDMFPQTAEIEVVADLKIND